MKLSKLISNIDYTFISKEREAEITGICRDNRTVRPGDLFICVKGALFDPHKFVSEIAQKDAAALVVEYDIECPPGLPVVRVKDSRAAMSQIAAEWYDHPSKKMTMIGITGSKGKTTTAYILRDMLALSGRTVGMVGTNGVFIGDRVIETPNTTPDPLDFQAFLADMVESGCESAVIECSSQGIMQHRVDGVEFEYGIFTNISDSDHVGPPEHADFEEYIFYKSRLLARSRKSIVNIEDPLTPEMLRLAGVDSAITFGFSDKADYRAVNIEKAEVNNKPGARFEVAGKLSGRFGIDLPGDFNVLNALAAISVAGELGLPQSAMSDALEHIFIKGRIEMVYESDRFSVCVDYSHNGYSMKNLLIALREYNPKRLVSVFGADGYRVHKRRYEMGEVSGEYADFSIITAGQSRWEKFDDILAEIIEGIGKTGAPYVVIPDRKQAVRYAIENAQPGDLIAFIGLGGKKHYEEKGIMYEYREDEYVLEVIKELGL